MDPRISSYLAKNKEWASDQGYTAPMRFKDMQRKGREREDGTVIVLACTDPRVTPEEFLGMDAGSKATVIRTAGGRVQAAMSTLMVLSAVGNEGKKGVIMVVHHTDCGLSYIADRQIVESLSRRGFGLLQLVKALENVQRKSVASEEERIVLDGMRFGSFEDPEKSVTEDVEVLRAVPFFKGMQILGFVQDTESGILKEVVGVE